MRKTRVVALLLALAITVSCFALTASAKKITELDSSVPFVAIYKEGSYGEYMQMYARASAVEGRQDIDLASFSDSKDVELAATFEEKDNVLVTKDTGFVEYKVTVPATGLYGLGCTYYPIEGKGVAIERRILINGEIPYSEAKTASLDRHFSDDVDWANLNAPDENGIIDNFFPQVLDPDTGKKLDQVRNSTVEQFGWYDNAHFSDSTGSYDGALQFYLEKGENTIRIESSREPCAFSELYLYGVTDSISYTEFLAQNPGLEAKGSDIVVKVQAEYPTSRSSTSIYPNYDRSSAATEPESSSVLKYNTIGGSNWKTSGQWVEYTVNVPEDGLYKLVFRARQNVTSGTFSSRQIIVNGETPVEEALQIRFNYSSAWQMCSPKDAYDNDVLFRLNKGDNKIRIVATTGELSSYINAVDTVVEKLNTDYRKIMAITGSDPDEYREYDLDIEIPETISDLKAQGDVLTSVYNNLVDIMGGEGQQTAIIYNVVQVLYKMAEDPDKIAVLFSNFKNQITNLGSWLGTMRDQPLSIDYILVTQSGYKSKSADANFFKSAWHDIVMFASSFTSDSNKVKSVEGAVIPEDANNITVWTTTSKDRAQLKQRLIERTFVQDYGVGVNLELVPGGALLPSVFAGKGPDIVMGLGETDVINYASRNALVALNDFEGFNELKADFAESAFIPTQLEMFTDETHTETRMLNYGLPETQSFHVLFYREDVLSDMGLEVPKTWDDVYDLIAVLKKRYMDFAPPDFLTILYQRNGSIYKNNGYQINLDDETCIQSFITVTDFYITYNCPKSYNFQNRFRFGEMPIGMSDYTFYNTLSVAAPEIKGTWTFSQIPGTKQADGSIRTVTYTTVGSICMLNAATEKTESYKQDCWKYMKWWVSEDTQVEFGTELEASLGVAARYGTANQKAAQRLPWTTQELEALMGQWNNTVGYENQVAGYYYTRYYGFAFNEVLDDYADARETLLNYVQEINKEIKYKREQLNLPYSDSAN